MTLRDLGPGRNDLPLTVWQAKPQFPLCREGGGVPSAQVMMMKLVLHVRVVCRLTSAGSDHSCYPELSVWARHRSTRCANNPPGAQQEAGQPTLSHDRGGDCCPALVTQPGSGGWGLTPGPWAPGPCWPSALLVHLCTVFLVHLWAIFLVYLWSVFLIYLWLGCLGHLWLTFPRLFFVVASKYYNLGNALLSSLREQILIFKMACQALWTSLVPITVTR